ncbi:hypothetical protein [Roseateles sp.]|uniref:hypothetical protein n=1 Tax=Roseateles sp. TaxID=1971397 RepID=UPI0039E8C1D0
MNINMRALVLFLAMMTSHLGHAAEPLQTFGISLLQPQEVFQSRVQSVEALATYIKSVQRVTNDFLSAQPHGQPTNGFIVLAVRPGQQSRVWLDLKPEFPAQAAAQLKTAIGRSQPLIVNHGPVVFAISVGIWGGSASTAKMPAPSEFAVAAKATGRPLEVGDLVERIWND